MRLIPWKVVALLLIAWTWPSWALDVRSIPSPRPAGWVTDLAGLLSPEAKVQLDALGNAVHASNGAELAIVTVRSTGGEDAHAFALRLFNHWGIGNQKKNNGVLIFVAIDDRAAELMLGDGVDSDEMVDVSEGIMQREMVPRFREGDAEAAIVAGALAASSDILGVKDLSAAPVTKLSQRIRRPALEPSTDSSYSYFGGVENWAPKAAGGAGGLGALWVGFRRWRRYRARQCPQCSAQMTRLDESTDDRHLSGSEKKEEQLGSVDYDIWACTACSTVSKQRYGAFFTRYARCPKCDAVTKTSNSTTLVAANYDRGGRVRVDERCEACSYSHSYERATAKLTRSSSSSGRSGFSGGSSSGRGSSGRW